MSKPRIIGGVAKGRMLDVPKRGTRPSPARLREALFNRLAFAARGTFLDLFAGSGAVGLEAASRGWRVTCVDLSREAAAVIRRNARALQLEVRVIQTDALAFIEQTEPFDIVFAAPPYPLELSPIFEAILRSGVAKGGLYIFQFPEQFRFAPAADRFTLELRRYGSNMLAFVQERQGAE
jgi:16S rRNA (guanine(966)-N(2))-methyltransferase RsmD